MKIDADTESSARWVYSIVKQRIVEGSYVGGTRLTETSLSREFGTSRTPVREAIRLLVADGFLRFKPNSGAFVRAYSRQEMRDIFDLRMLVETEVAASAAHRITAEAIQELEEIQDRIEARGADIEQDNLDRMAPLNRRVHTIIGQACDNERLLDTLRNVMEVKLVMDTYRRYTPQQLARSFHHHRELIDAFRARDAGWARAVMACHLRSAKLAMLGTEGFEAESMMGQ